MRHALDCGMCCGLQVCDCGAEQEYAEQKKFNYERTLMAEVDMISRIQVGPRPAPATPIISAALRWPDDFHPPVALSYVR